MRKIFQERISNSELKKNKSGFFYPKCLEIWNRNSSKTFNETLKRIIGYDKDIRVSFLSDTMFTVLADKKYQGVIEYGDMDEMPKIKLTEGNISRVYEVLNIEWDNETLINLDSEITNRNEKEIIQMFSKNIAYFILKLDDITYRISVYNNSDENKVFELPYEEDLKETLFTFTENTSVVEIVKALEYYLGRLDTYPKIEISRTIKEPRKFPRTTDEFILKNGTLDKFMQTKKVGTKTYVVTIQDNRISYNIDNLSFGDDVTPNKELVEQSMQYVKKYPKK